MSFETTRTVFSQLRSDVGGLAKLIGALPGFLEQRVTPQKAEEELKNDLELREERFLQILQTQIFERPQSPYLKLFRFAGCEISDLRTSVRRCGVEQTLERLAREGVYLTSAEFKGKKEVIRGRESFRVFPGSFDNGRLSAGYRGQSSGTSNDPTRSFVTLDLLEMRTTATYFAFVAHDLFSRAHAIYDAILPAASAINNFLIYAKLNVAAERWFARTIPAASKPQAIYYRLVTKAVVRAARRSNPQFPEPEFFIDGRETDHIVRWIADNQRRNRTCCVATAASNAVRIARVASGLGIPLDGVKFIAGGEPLTESKQQEIAKAGASAIPRYSYGGNINIGIGCANPLHTDELHVNQHLLVLLPSPHPHETGNHPVHPLLCTTLHPAFPRLLVNVESGDYGVFTVRDCGCALEKAGLRLHLHGVRSYEKFTSEGMNYFYGDLFEFVEKTLPREFGGGPGDYQLVEEEDSTGQSRLSILVDPGIQSLNEEKLLARLYERFAQGSHDNRLTSKIWQDAGTFRIRRQVPHSSGRGKIQPLHIVRRIGKDASIIDRSVSEND